MNNRTDRAFKFNEPLGHILASKELIDRVYNIFKMIFHNKSCKIKCHYMEKIRTIKVFYGMINSPQTIKGENRYGSRTVYNKKKKRATLKIRAYLKTQNR